MLLPLLRLVSLATLLPFASDTPPAVRVPAPAPHELRAVDDVVLTARMADGVRAPAAIVLPQLENRREVFAFLRANYPDTSAAAAPEVVPVAWVYIDEAGVPHFPQLILKSGAASFDSLAIALVGRARFAPAQVAGKVVPVWVMLPVQLSLSTALEMRPQDPERPYFTPYTQKPELLNRDSVARALVRNYPAELRAGGVGGTTQVWVYLDAAGKVTRVLVKQSSGNSLLDDAALRVARIMFFSPAQHQGRNVAVWITLPIVFRSR